MTDVLVRDANESDIDGLRELFMASYAGAYPFEGFLDRNWLLRSVYRDDIQVLVATDADSGELLGTGSVVFDLGTDSDLLGEFGRLAVHPAARGKGVGRAIMAGRCRFAEARMHVAIAQNRCIHPFSQRVSRAFDFAPVGFLPMKYLMSFRESVVLWARHFGQAFEHRRNHPRVIPEVHGLASLALTNCGLPDDAVIDEAAE
ncbi:MAG: GNAT family N-acetyltransferase, partial [Myxococcota bacterium]